jgi:hypothetical protein
MLSVVALAAVPFAALCAADKNRPTAAGPAAGAASTATPLACPPAAQAPGVPQTATQIVPFIQPPEGPPEGPPQIQCPAVYCPPPLPAQPELQQMIAELKQLRDREHKLAAAIRDKIKAQRQSIDDAERELNGAPTVPQGIISPTCIH